MAGLCSGHPMLWLMPMAWMAVTSAAMTIQHISRFALSLRLGMADDALDRRKAPAQSALDRVDQFVDVADRAGFIDVAVEVHDLAVGGMAHPQIVDMAQLAARGGQLGKRGLD